MFVYAQMLEVEVRKLLDVTESIHDEMFQLRERYYLATKFILKCHYFFLFTLRKCWKSENKDGFVFKDGFVLIVKNYFL